MLGLLLKSKLYLRILSAFFWSYLYNPNHISKFARLIVKIQNISQNLICLFGRIVVYLLSVQPKPTISQNLFCTAYLYNPNQPYFRNSSATTWISMELVETDDVLRQFVWTQSPTTSSSSASRTATAGTTLARSFGPLCRGGRFL